MHEQRRQDCLREQLAAEKRGDQELAATWRAHAEANTSERDRVQREEERRATNRSLASRRRYY